MNKSCAILLQLFPLEHASFDDLIGVSKIKFPWKMLTNLRAPIKISCFTELDVNKTPKS